MDQRDFVFAYPFNVERALPEREQLFTQCAEVAGRGFDHVSPVWKRLYHTATKDR
jgi:hypothetical protein